MRDNFFVAQLCARDGGVEHVISILDDWIFGFGFGHSSYFPFEILHEVIPQRRAVDCGNRHHKRNNVFNAINVLLQSLIVPSTRSHRSFIEMT